MGQSLTSGCDGMKYIFLISVLFLTGCKDVYRYPCQNPDNFHLEQCQKPKCLFTQMCPEYLVAPILEKKVNDVQSEKPNP
jgi:hypothetical protein